MGSFFCRPSQEFRRDTLNNISQNNQFTINHVKTDFIEKAHYTSAKFPANISEFERCHLTEEFHDNFLAPFVQESEIKMGLTTEEIIHIKSSGTSLIIGRIQHLFIADGLVDPEGYINLEQAQSAGISGLNSYYNNRFLTSFPYAREHEMPTFEKK